LSLLRGQPGTHEVVGSRDGSQERRQRRGVVAVPASRQDPQRRRREAEARSAKAERSLPGGPLDVLFRSPELAVGPLFGIQVQPGLVVKRVVADSVSCRDRACELPCFLWCRVLAY